MLQSYVTTNVILHSIPTVVQKSIDSIKNIVSSNEISSNYSSKERILSLDLDSKLSRYKILLEDIDLQSFLYYSNSIKNASNDVEDTILKLGELLKTLEYRLQNGSFSYMFISRLWYIEESNEKMIKTLEMLTIILEKRVEFLFEILRLENLYKSDICKL